MANNKNAPALIRAECEVKTMQRQLQNVTYMKDVRLRLMSTISYGMRKKNTIVKMSHKMSQIHTAKRRYLFHVFNTFKLIHVFFGFRPIALSQMVLLLSIKS